jgi:hypothetical protein
MKPDDTAQMPHGPQVGFNALSSPRLALLLSPLPCPPGIGPCDLGDEEAAVDPSNQIWSISPAEGYSVLSVPYLAKGSYLLTVMEMSGKTVELPSSENVDKEKGDGGKEGCLRFSLRIRTSRADLTTQLSSLSAITGGNPPVPLPTTLNTVMYLKYGGIMHSFGTYAFPRSGACKHTVTFDLAQDSRFRLDARAVARGRVAATVTRMGDKVRNPFPSSQKYSRASVNGCVRPFMLHASHFWYSRESRLASSDTGNFACMQYRKVMNRSLFSTCLHNLVALCQKTYQGHPSPCLKSDLDFPRFTLPLRRFLK